LRLTSRPPVAFREQFARQAGAPYLQRGAAHLLHEVADRVVVEQLGSEASQAALQRCRRGKHGEGRQRPPEGTPARAWGLRRPARDSQRWRVVFQGSDPPPSRLITARMARELGLGRICTP
jgi:hypothetical protein